jgi:hypothetical protein
MALDTTGRQRVWEVLCQWQLGASFTTALMDARGHQIE